MKDQSFGERKTQWIKRYGCIPYDYHYTNMLQLCNNRQHLPCTSYMPGFVLIFLCISSHSSQLEEVSRGIHCFLKILAVTHQNELWLRPTWDIYLYLFSKITNYYIVYNNIINKNYKQNCPKSIQHELIEKSKSKPMNVPINWYSLLKKCVSWKKNGRNLLEKNSFSLKMGE